jgi:hypothetical protein
MAIGFPQLNKSDMITWSNFVNSSSGVFEFLVKEYNFKLVSTEQPFVNYDKPGIRISLFYDANRRGEIDIGIRRLPVSEQFVDSFKLSEFQQLPPNTFPEPPLIEFAPSQLDVETVLNDMASRLRRYCPRTLRGEFPEIVAIEAKRRETKQEP